MQYGDRIINGILSLICLEPCHSPTVPLVQEEVYGAHLACTHSWVSILPFFLKLHNNETVPGYYFLPPSLCWSVLPLLLSSSEVVFLGLSVCWSLQMENIGTKLVKDYVSGIFRIHFNYLFLNLGMCAEYSIPNTGPTKMIIINKLKNICLYVKCI